METFTLHRDDQRESSLRWWSLATGTWCWQVDTQGGSAFKWKEPQKLKALVRKVWELKVERTRKRLSIVCSTDWLTGWQKHCALGGLVLYCLSPLFTGLPRDKRGQEEGKTESQFSSLLLWSVVAVSRQTDRAGAVRADSRGEGERSWWSCWMELPHYGETYVAAAAMAAFAQKSMASVSHVPFDTTRPVAVRALSAVKRRHRGCHWREAAERESRRW